MRDKKCFPNMSQKLLQPWIANHLYKPAALHVLHTILEIKIIEACISKGIRSKIKKNWDYKYELHTTFFSRIIWRTKHFPYCGHGISYISQLYSHKRDMCQLLAPYASTTLRLRLRWKTSEHPISFTKNFAIYHNHWYVLCFTLCMPLYDMLFQTTVISIMDSITHV